MCPSISSDTLIDVQELARELIVTCMKYFHENNEGKVTAEQLTITTSAMFFCLESFMDTLGVPKKQFCELLHQLLNEM